METWQPIPGYGGYYEVSDLGRVRSLRQKQARILAPVITNGYHRLFLGRGQSVYVHQLVAQAFIGPCPAGEEVRHLDGCRTNNRASNLTYGTRAQNMQDAILHGTITNGNAAKEECRNGHPFDEANTYRCKGKRYCRACRNKTSRDWKRDHRATR